MKEDDCRTGDKILEITLMKWYSKLLYPKQSLT